jgi:hypothetical protein
MPFHVIATGAAACSRVASFRQQLLSPKRQIGPGIAVIADLVRAATRHLFHPYRPELHYMRGPGPKWRELHAQRRRGE